MPPVKEMEAAACSTNGEAAIFDLSTLQKKESIGLPVAINKMVVDKARIGLATEATIFEIYDRRRGKPEISLYGH